MSLQSSQGPVTPVPLFDAIRYARHWRNYFRQLFPPKHRHHHHHHHHPDQPEILRAFFIPIGDLAKLARFSAENARGARAYLCMKKADDPSTLHLLLVPVGHDGHDQLNSSPGSDPLINSDVYDLTQPCPDYCDISSPMYEEQP